jgi:hypothetical protein
MDYRSSKFTVKTCVERKSPEADRYIIGQKELGVVFFLFQQLLPPCAVNFIWAVDLAEQASLVLMVPVMSCVWCGHCHHTNYLQASMSDDQSLYIDIHIDVQADIRL